MLGNRHKQENGHSFQDSIMAGKSSLDAIWYFDSMAPGGRNEQR